MTLWFSRESGLRHDWLTSNCLDDRLRIASSVVMSIFRPASRANCRSVRPCSPGKAEVNSGEGWMGSHQGFWPASRAARDSHC
eukprot:5724239-Lingulodinium_polyedra.AAC.1